ARGGGLEGQLRRGAVLCGAVPGRERRAGAVAPPAPAARAARCGTGAPRERGGVCVSGIFFFFQAEDGIRDWSVTGVQTCALPISLCQEQISSQVERPEGAALVDQWGRVFGLGATTAIGRQAVSGAIGIAEPSVSRSEERRVGKEGGSRWAPER